MNDAKLLAGALWETLRVMAREIRAIEWRYWLAMNIVVIAWVLGVWLAQR